MQCNNVMEPERLSEIRILQIRSKATGSSVHAVCNLIGAYQMAIKLAEECPSEATWREIAQRNAVKLQVFFRTGLVERSG
jgi:hypothetical protein